jgi:hypothetical protein
VRAGRDGVDNANAGSMQVMQSKESLLCDLFCEVHGTLFDLSQIVLPRLG